MCVCPVVCPENPLWTVRPKQTPPPLNPKSRLILPFWPVTPSEPPVLSTQNPTSPFFGRSPPSKRPSSLRAPHRQPGRLDYHRCLKCPTFSVLLKGGSAVLGADHIGSFFRIIFPIKKTLSSNVFVMENLERYLCTRCVFF